MSSIRENRKQLAEQCRELITTTESQLEFDQKQLRILEMASQVLREVPTVRATCGYTLEYVEVNVWIDRGHCSECKTTITGFQKGVWRFCPACGSSIGHVERESGPNDRIARANVDQAVAELQLSAVKQ